MGINIKDYAVSVANDLRAVRNPREGGMMISNILNTVGRDPAVVSLLLTHVEDHVSLHQSVQMFEVMKRIVAGVDRMVGARIRNELWFNDQEYFLGTELIIVEKTFEMRCNEMHQRASW